MIFTRNTDLEREFYMKKLNVTEGQLSDLEKQYLLQELSLQEGSVQDLWIQWFNSQGVSSGTINDRWYTFLLSEGYTGSVTDMINKYYEDEIAQ